jgi:hypothetical protein
MTSRLAAPNAYAEVPIDYLPSLPPPRHLCPKVSCTACGKWSKMSALAKTAAVVVVVLVLAVVGVVVASRFVGGKRKAEACVQRGRSDMEVALCLHDRTPMADGHNDLPWAYVSASLHVA